MPGYAGPSSEGRRGLNKYIVTDMYAKAMQGMTPEDSGEVGAGELAKIYG